MDIRSRYGTFRISRELIHQTPEQVSDILAFMRFVPTRTECLFRENSIEYTGMSHIFPLLQDGEMVPEYKLCIVHQGDTLVNVSASPR